VLFNKQGARKMKITYNILFICLIITIAIFPANIFAQDTDQKENKVKSQDQEQMMEQEKGKNNQEFVDEDGDGYNDNAPDHDGDGIPNGLDPDYQALQKREREKKRNEFVDLDGDGINDNMVNSGEERGPRRIGPGPGTGQPADAPHSEGDRQQRKQKGKDN
jgi:hypothetical protein